MLYKKNDKLNNIDIIRENTQLRKENFDLKNRLSWRINYCQELEKDLFENCENYVISKDRIKEQIKNMLNCQMIFMANGKIYLHLMKIIKILEIKVCAVMQ